MSELNHLPDPFPYSGDIMNLQVISADGTLHNVQVTPVVCSFPAVGLEQEVRGGRRRRISWHWPGEVGQISPFLQQEECWVRWVTPAAGLTINWNCICINTQLLSYIGSVERALAAHGSSTVTNKPKDYNDQIEPIEAEDPLVTYVTREQALAEEELKKIFPQLYPAPIQGEFRTIDLSLYRQI